MSQQAGVAGPFPRRDVATVIVAAGAGVRMGPGAPKALRALAGEPLVRRAVRAVTGTAEVGWVVVAAPPGLETDLRELLAALPAARPEPAATTGGAAEVFVVPGGAERRESVAAALAAVPPGPEIILVHDAARALAPSALVAAVAAEIRAGHDAVIPVLPVTDTIAEVGPAGELRGNPDRANLRAVQTPQGFRREVLEAAHRDAAGGATDDAGLVAQLGVAVQTIPGSPYAMKITTQHDMAVAEALLAHGVAGGT